MPITLTYSIAEVIEGVPYSATHEINRLQLSTLLTEIAGGVEQIGLALGELAEGDFLRVGADGAIEGAEVVLQQQVTGFNEDVTGSLAIFDGGTLATNSPDGAAGWLFQQLYADAGPDVAARVQIGANSDSGRVAVRWSADGETYQMAGINAGFLQARWEGCDFHNSTVTPPFVGAAISGGTVTVVAAAYHVAAHPGSVLLRCNTTTNGGYLFATSSQLVAAAGLAFRAVLAGVGAWTNTTVRLGLHDSATVSDAVDGAYFEIAAGTASAKTANNSTRTTDATTLALTIDTFYTFDIDFVSATEVRFRISNDAGALLFDRTITTNAPSGTSRLFTARIVATNTATTATDLIALDYAGVGPARPNALLPPIA